MAAGTTPPVGSGGRIECYVDIASFFSYIAVLQLVETGNVLKQHGVQVDIYPVLIAAINAGSGNKPPWTLPAKAAYLSRDTYHAKVLVGLDPATTQTPPDLFSAARTQSANRALTYISRHFPTRVYHEALLGLFAKFWTVTPGTTSSEQDQAARDLTTPEKVGAALADLFPSSSSTSNSKNNNNNKGSAEKLFTTEQITQIVKAAEAPEYKTQLKARTEEVLKRGAFGAPWFWITPAPGTTIAPTSSPSAAATTTTTGGLGDDKSEKKGEPVFGSDRWHVIFNILGLPYTKLALQPPQSSTSKL